ncbi:MAG: nitrophenyl compound nitroreductase subunit ArsF family protein, partial [Planctomycetota bacterium]
SVAYLVVGELRSGSQPPAAEVDLPEAEPNQELSSQTPEPPNAPPKSSQKVVVYYFHGTTRCPTCRKFEAFTGETLRQAFPEALRRRRLKWRVLNVDKPANEHFVSDYQLHTRAIVVAKIRDGKQTEWKNLEKTKWLCIWGQTDVRAFSGSIVGVVVGYPDLH